jgi:hypothetical protein
MRFYFGIIGDAGSTKWTFNPGALPSGFSITGGTTNGFWLATQRSDGTAHITICPQVPFFAGKTYSDPGSTNWTINFGKQVGVVNVYDPCVASDAYGGQAASQTVSPNSNFSTWTSAPIAPSPVAHTNISSLVVATHLGPIVVEIMP